MLYKEYIDIIENELQLFLKRFESPLPYYEASEATGRLLSGTPYRIRLRTDRERRLPFAAGNVSINELSQQREGVESNTVPKVPYYDYLLYHFGFKNLNGESGANGSYRIPGKRLRPVMSLLICKALMGDYRRALPLILSTEILHNASLIHDDIQDHDEMRWGRPTVWKVCGVEQGINCGDTLQAMAYGLILDLYDSGFGDGTVRKILAACNRVHMTVVEGQAMDLMFEKRLDIAEYEYFEMISRKTAVPYAGIAECAAIVALDEKNPEAVQSYKDFGLKFGMLFQLTDDLLGIWGGMEKTGKIPADIANRKKTLPIIFAFNNASRQDREKLISLYTGSKKLDSYSPIILEILERSGAKSACQDWAGKFYDDTLRALEKTYIVNPFHDELKYMVDYCFKRGQI